MTGGTLIRIIPKTLFDFGYLPVSTTDSIIVAKAINVIPHSAAYLYVRVYQVRIGPGAPTPTIKVVATPTLPADDTQQSFLGTSIATNITATGLVTASLFSTAHVPPYYQISVEGTTPASTTNLGAEISIDLLVRCCG